MTGAVVALGDSISAGVGDAVGPGCVHGPGWAAHLATLLGAPGFRNLARNGARSRDVVEAQLPAALALRPELATLVVGGNDALRSDFSAAAIARDLTATVAALVDVGARVVLATLPPIGLFELGPAPVRRVMRARVESINAAVRRAAGPVGEGVVVVDVRAAVVTAGARAWHVDRVHPSPLGHRTLAVAAAQALWQELSGPGLGMPGRGPDDSPWDDLLALLAPPPAATPPVAERLAWLAFAGVPWAVRRGRDFLPGLARAVVDDLRAGVAAAQVGVGSAEECPAATRAA